MHRRSLLVAATGALAGCAGVFGDGERDGGSRGRFEVPNETVTRTIQDERGRSRQVIEDRTVGEEFETTTPTPVPTSVPDGPRNLAIGEAFRTADGTVVSVHSPTVRTAVECRPTACSSIRTSSDGQFLTTAVSVNGFNLGPAMPSGDPVVEALADGRFRVVLAGQGFEYDPAGSLVSFSLPLVNAAEGYVEWVPADGGPVRWYLDGRTLADLSRRSDFTFKSLSAPTSLPAGSEFTRALVRLVVVNTGGRDGEFLGRFVVDTGRQSSDYVVTHPAPRGELTDILRELPVPTEQSGAVEIRLEWADDAVSVTVPVRSGGGNGSRSSSNAGHDASVTHD